MTIVGARGRFCLHCFRECFDCFGIIVEPEVKDTGNVRNFGGGGVELCEDLLRLAEPAGIEEPDRLLD